MSTAAARLDALQLVICRKAAKLPLTVGLGSWNTSFLFGKSGGMVRLRGLRGDRSPPLF